jgi:cation diffusion facilitator family transporter
MRASLLVAVLMLVGKLGAYWVTGSAAILSDAAESVVHGFATGIAAISLWYAHRPADRQHPYGHGKIAFFSAGFEGALIFAAAAFIFYSSILSLIRGPELQQLGIGIAITGALGLVNLALGLALVTIGKKHNALILVANGKHVLTDMWTSLGVVIGVGIVWVTDILWLDPVIAMLVATNILVSGTALMLRAYHGLLDEADRDQTQTLMACLEEAVESGEISAYHQLRHRQTNDVMWVELHMLQPGEMPLDEAHRKVTVVEERLRDAFPAYRVHVTTHIEPAAHDRAHPQGHPGLADPYEESVESSPEGGGSA